MMESLDQCTQRQREVYEFIREKIRSRGYGPTVREIAEQFNIRSPNGVVCHLKALEKKGWIKRAPNMSRAIELVAEPIRPRGFRLAGQIAAGVLHEAIEQHELVDFDEFFSPEDAELFVLKVSGDSMIEDHIADGDFVVIRRQATARAGQIVVAITDEGDATLKRWYPEKDRIRLQPANSQMKPIYVKDARVIGVVLGVVRKVS